MTNFKGLKIMLDFKWQSSPSGEKHIKEERSHLSQLSDEGERSNRALKYQRE